MSAAGIIAHCLTPSGPPPVVSSLWWTAGDGIVQKVQDGSAWAHSYVLPGDDVGQVIVADNTRQRVFFPSQSGVYVFENFNSVDPIPAPTLVTVPWLGTYGSWVYNNAIRLDPASGQLFLANGAGDSVSIIGTDNSVNTITGFDNVFYIWALGSGKFSVLDDFGTRVEVWGPSNSYASALVSQLSPASTLITSSAYDPATDLVICYLESDQGGLWTVNASTGTTGLVEIDGHYGSVMFRDQYSGNVVLSQTGDLGKLWVYNPNTGGLVSSINYSGERPGWTLSGQPLDLQTIDDTLAVLQRWDNGPDLVMVLHLCSISTGAVLSSYTVPGVQPGNSSNIGVSYEDGTFAVTHAGDFKLFVVYYDSPYTVGEVFEDDVGSTTVAHTFTPDS